MRSSLGIAVIGAGMAGKAHAAGYRAAPTIYHPLLPDLRYVSIADVNADLATTTSRRYGFERGDTCWQAVAEADDIDVVSVVVANHLHREIVEALLAAGKHVLCEKPLSDSLDDARAMAAAARSAGTVARLGFVYRRSPALTAIRKLVMDGVLGDVLHVAGRYWCDYACSPHSPMSWRFKGPHGSGALADVGSHLGYVAEYLAGDTVEVAGGVLRTAITDRFLPLGEVIGHEHGALTDISEPVENDDYAAYSARFSSGAAGTMEVSRVAAGHPNSLMVDVFGSLGAAHYDLRRPAEFELYLQEGAQDHRGGRRVLLGPDHPYLRGGLAMDAQGVGLGQNDLFVYQARAFLDEVAGVGDDQALPPCAGFEEGVHNMQLLAAVVQSAADSGRAVPVPAQNTDPEGPQR